MLCMCNGGSGNLLSIENRIFSTRSIERKMGSVLRTVHLLGSECFNGMDHCVYPSGSSNLQSHWSFLLFITLYNFTLLTCK
jgi:hypothetical protein